MSEKELAWALKNGEIDKVKQIIEGNVRDLLISIFFFQVIRMNDDKINLYIYLLRILNRNN